MKIMMALTQDFILMMIVVMMIRVTRNAQQSTKSSSVNPDIPKPNRASRVNLNLKRLNIPKAPLTQMMTKAKAILSHKYQVSIK